MLSAAFFFDKTESISFRINAAELNLIKN